MLDAYQQTGAFVVYVITCLSNGKRYVGKAASVRDRWRAHRDAASASRTTKCASALRRAMRRHGVANFRIDVLSEHEAESAAFAAEMAAIVEQGSRSPLGYNLTDGGEGASGWTHTAEARKRIGDARKGRPLKESTRAKIANTLRGRKGAPRTDEQRAHIAAAKLGTKLSETTRKKISESRKGRYFGGDAGREAARLTAKSMVRDEAWRAKVGAGSRGKKRSEETKAKLRSIAQNRSPETRAKMASAQRGRRASDETRAKMSAAQKARNAAIREAKLATQ